MSLANYFSKVPGKVFILKLDKKPAVVPCGGCKLCCKGTPVMIIEAAGDKVDTYETQIGPDGQRYLRMRDNGDCVYLGYGGCTIHDRVPYACRSYDCREHYRMYNKVERKEMIAMGAVSGAIMKRGKELLGKGKRGIK